MFGKYKIKSQSTSGIPTEIFMSFLRSTDKLHYFNGSEIQRTVHLDILL